MPEKQNKKSEEKAADSNNLITDNKESISEKIKPKDSETKTNKDQNKFFENRQTQKLQRRNKY